MPTKVTEEEQDVRSVRVSGAASAQENGEIEIDLAALLLRYVEKIYWIILLALLGAGIAAGIDYRLVTPLYQATSKIYIVGSDTTISLSDLQIGSNLAADYREVFKNWHVHEMVDERLGLNYSYGKLSGMVSVTNPANTHVLYVTVTSPDPKEAKDLADTYALVAREFIAAKMDMREPNIFEEAKKPDRPVSPQKTRDIVIGFLLGALLAMVVITIKFITDDRIRTADDIAKVGNLPTLGLIPLQDMKRNAEEGEPSSAYGQRSRKSGKE